MMFSTFRQAIMDFTPPPARQLPDNFLLRREGRLAEYYIPFDYLNPAARLVLVGITPGYQQWLHAVTAAHQALKNGATDQQALYLAKQQGAFSGAIRNNLTQLLDAIGLSGWLGIASCSSLFSDHLSLVHFTSLFNQPVFIDGKNYNNTPSFRHSPLLQHSIERGFAAEARQLPDAVFVPLGPVASAGVEWLVQQQQIDPAKILTGLPHPSGANSERIHYFPGKKTRDTLSRHTNPQALDLAREKLITKVAKLR
ncbi:MULTISPECIES: hypothetical protein [unclassified Tatumella]|uniref:hypothetical protein n=1 Tax=unclassified Tatumella TaxID=2649542 RepID=UPI001BB03248|nr:MULTISPECIES: hypothetical protein [unclassified Tatumella]MBS0857422.1 hypothetical protein [Tatumella sp. JGM16]MBS0913249.1 hypothetical protein [Tatumella sp. JGM91]